MDTETTTAPILVLVFRPGSSIAFDLDQSFQEGDLGGYYIPICRPKRVDENRRCFFTAIDKASRRVKAAHKVHGAESAKFFSAWIQLEKAVRKWESTQ